MTRAKRTGLRRNAFIALAAKHKEAVADLAKELSREEDRVLVETADQFWEFVGRV